jgi:hypothetical protein
VKHQYDEMETTEENHINSQPKLKQSNINRQCKQGLGADEPLAHPVAWLASMTVTRWLCGGEFEGGRSPSLWHCRRNGQVDNFRDFDDGQIDGF